MLVYFSGYGSSLKAGRPTDSVSNAHHLPISITKMCSSNPPFFLLSATHMFVYSDPIHFVRAIMNQCCPEKNVNPFCLELIPCSNPFPHVLLVWPNFWPLGSPAVWQGPMIFKRFTWRSTELHGAGRETNICRMDWYGKWWWTYMVDLS